jgi:hypothetical protein
VTQCTEPEKQECHRHPGHFETWRWVWPDDGCIEDSIPEIVDGCPKCAIEEVTDG